MKERKLFWRILLALVTFIFVINAAFWILVGTQFSSVVSEYESGRIIRLGRVALVFGHGSWMNFNGVESHYTTVSDHGELISKRTIELVHDLEKEGIRWIWGSWCYSGDHDYIVRDHITSEEIPWPENVSRNKDPGVTLPIWIGLGFIRVSLGEAHQYGKYPPRHQNRLPSDTVRVKLECSNCEHKISVDQAVRNSIDPMLFEAAFPQPDSITGISVKTIVRDETLLTEQWNDLYGQYWDYEITEGEWRKRSEWWQGKREEFLANFDRLFVESITIEQVHIWIRGKSIPIWIKIDPVVIYKG